MLKKIAIGFLVVVAGFVAFVASRPSHYHVERTLAIGAPASVVFDQVATMKTWRAWSPWDKIDPNVQMTYEGPERGVGASYSWKGNDEVGAGKMTTIESTEPSHLGFDLQFLAPFESSSKASFDFKPSGSTVDVTWSMDGESNFMSKLFGTFVSMDAMIGKDFDKGLAQLKTLAEAEAKKQEEQRAAAQVAAAQAAAAQAAAVAQAGAAQGEPAAPAQAAAK